MIYHELSPLLHPCLCSSVFSSSHILCHISMSFAQFSAIFVHLSQNWERMSWIIGALFPVLSFQHYLLLTCFVCNSNRFWTELYFFVDSHSMGCWGCTTKIYLRQERVLWQNVKCQDGLNFTKQCYIRVEKDWIGPNLKRLHCLGIFLRCVTCEEALGDSELLSGLIRQNYIFSRCLRKHSAFLQLKLFQLTKKCQQI